MGMDGNQEKMLLSSYLFLDVNIQNILIEFKGLNEHRHSSRPVYLYRSKISSVCN